MDEENLCPVGTTKYEFGQKTNTGLSLRVDFIRHGATDYTGLPGDLKEEGRRQVLATAERIAETIRPERERVILWASPASRAQATADIVANCLKSRGIDVERRKPIGSLSDRHFSREDGIAGMSRRFPELLQDEIEVRVTRLGTAAETESYEQASRRFKRVVEYLMRFAGGQSAEATRKLHFIIVAHHTQIAELLNFLGLKGREEGFQTAASVSLAIDPSKAKISASYREQVATVDWSSRHREYYYGSAN